MRKLIIIFTCSIVLLLLGYVSYRGYGVWRQGRSMTMARECIAKKDIPNALLSLRNILRSDPRNVEATRLMAGIMEGQRSPTTLFWWQRVVELNPDSTENRIALAKAALLYKEFLVASNALAAVSQADQETASYQEMAGGVAMMMGNVKQAQANFSEALRLEPANPLHKINLALLHLHGTNALDQSEARIDLRRFIQSSTNADLSLLVQRELVADAMRFNDLPTALSLSKGLAQRTNALFSDSLLRLDVLVRAKSAELQPTLARYQRVATNTPATLFDLSSWMMSRLSPADTLAWLKSLPPVLQTNPPAAVMVAQCLLMKPDWKGLENLLQPQDWGDLDFERHALLARALLEQNLTASSKSEWQQAVNGTKNNKIALKTLFSLSRQWGWNTESVEILWNLFNLYPEENNAWLALRQYFIETGNTPSLLHLIDIQNRRYPKDVPLKNDLALTALLLNVDQFKPHELAREIYPLNETNATVASTYAFSLYLQGKPAEALKVMQRLNARELSDPGIAGYYGLILKANGRKAEAVTYLKLSNNGTLLPEERKLFSKALVDP